MNCLPGFAFLNYTAYVASEVVSIWSQNTTDPLRLLTCLLGAPDCVSRRFLLANFSFSKTVFNELPDVRAPNQMKVATPRCPGVALAQI